MSSWASRAADSKEKEDNWSSSSLLLLSGWSSSSKPTPKSLSHRPPKLRARQDSQFVGVAPSAATEDLRDFFLLAAAAPVVVGLVFISRPSLSSKMTATSPSARARRRRRLRVSTSKTDSSLEARAFAKWSKVKDCKARTSPKAVAAYQAVTPQCIRVEGKGRRPWARGSTKICSSWGARGAGACLTAQTASRSLASCASRRFKSLVASFKSFTRFRDASQRSWATLYSRVTCSSSSFFCCSRSFRRFAFSWSFARCFSSSRRDSSSRKRFRSSFTRCRAFTCSRDDDTFDGAATDESSSIASTPSLAASPMRR
mmetsp:Transcript_33116/g.105711  ORF Transcript_33116/g.105711 Transcript_33116/m.105711 type:complete len:314 (-) Transcript_33116:35-976(-)